MRRFFCWKSKLIFAVCPRRRCCRWELHGGQFIIDLHRFQVLGLWIGWRWLQQVAQWGWLQEQSWTCGAHRRAHFCRWRCPPWRRSWGMIAADEYSHILSREWGIWPTRKDCAEEWYSRSCIRDFFRNPIYWHWGEPRSETLNLQPYDSTSIYFMSI